MVGFHLGAETQQNGVREREPERLMRIVVVGTSGAGKATLARKVAAQLELLHIELDAINWQSGWRDLTDTIPRNSSAAWLRRSRPRLGWSTATTVQCATWSGSAPPISSGSIMNAR